MHLNQTSMNDELRDLEENVRDYEKEMKMDMQWVKDAQDSLYKTKLRYAEAIIALDAYKKNNKLI